MPFNLFHKKKPEETPVATPQEEQMQPQPEAPAEPQQETVPADLVEESAPVPVEPIPVQEQPQPAAEPPIEQKPEVSPVTEAPSKTYLKAMPLRDISDLENVKTEVLYGNIIILKVTPLAQKSIEDVKNAVNELFQFAETIGGDIARLGEERIVICPKSVRIWREKSPKPIANEPLPSAA